MVGIVGFSVISFIVDRGRKNREALRNPAGMWMTLGGAIFGPFIGVSLSLFAAQRTYAGVVSTLIGLSPVLIIPPAILILKQKVKPLEVIGAVVAVAGSAVFFL